MNILLLLILFKYSQCYLQNTLSLNAINQSLVSTNIKFNYNKYKICLNNNTFVTILKDNDKYFKYCIKFNITSNPCFNYQIIDYKYLNNNYFINNLKSFFDKTCYTIFSFVNFNNCNIKQLFGSTYIITIYDDKYKILHIDIIKPIIIYNNYLNIYRKYFSIHTYLLYLIRHNFLLKYIQSLNISNNQLIVKNLVFEFKNVGNIYSFLNDKCINNNLQFITNMFYFGAFENKLHIYNKSYYTMNISLQIHIN